MKRRSALMKISSIGSLAFLPALPTFSMQSLLKRKIGSSGELLPCVGLGTWQTFDVGNDVTERKPLREVLTTLVNTGATVVDSSPMYGNSEGVVGDLSQELKVNDKLFIATKVWTTGKDPGIRQMDNSMRLLKRDKIDLMQIHNLVDWQVHLRTLQAWKEQGKIRYIGLTHYMDSAHETLRSIIEKNDVDFIQVNYSLNVRHAEKDLLPAAKDKGVAVLINRPFDEGVLFQKVKGKTLPAYAKEFDCVSWGSFFLKYLIANPAVTCVIPGTANPKHLVDNLSAGMGKLPEPSHLKKMIAEIS